MKQKKKSLKQALEFLKEILHIVNIVWTTLNFFQIWPRVRWTKKFCSSSSYLLELNWRLFHWAAFLFFELIFNELFFPWWPAYLRNVFTVQNSSSSSPLFILKFLWNLCHNFLLSLFNLQKCQDVVENTVHFPCCIIDHRDKMWVWERVGHYVD